MPFCVYCGHEIEAGFKFCDKCGKPVLSSNNVAQESRNVNPKQQATARQANVSIQQQPPNIDASISIKLEPSLVEASVDDVFDVRVLVFSNYELQSVTFDVQTGPGLAVLEYPRPANIIPASEEGFLDRIKIRALSFGRQTLQLTLRGEKAGVRFERSAQIFIRVKAPAPVLEVGVKAYPKQVPFGAQFAVILHLSNIGKGAAKSLELPTLNTLQSHLKTVQTFRQDAIIAPGSSLEQPIAFQAIKSGMVPINTLLLRYKDMDDIIYSKDLPSLEILIEIVTPQPQFDLQLLYSTTDLPQGEVHASYILANSGPADAALFRLKAVLSEGVLLNRGALSSIKPNFHHGQSERSDFYLNFESGKSTPKPIDHIEIQYSDAEGVSHTVKLTGEEMPRPAPSVPEPVTVAPVITPVQSTVAASITQGIPMPAPPEVVTLSVPPAEAAPAPPPPPPPQKPKPNYALLLEKGTSEDWSKLLEGSDDEENKIDLSTTAIDEETYKDQGYRNLLLAVFDSKLSKKELLRKFVADKFTERCVEFLAGLKATGYAEYGVSGSDIQYADETLSILSTDNAPQAPLAEPSAAKKSKGPKPRQIAFLSSQGKTVEVVREIIMDMQEERPDAIRFTLKPLS